MDIKDLLKLISRISFTGPGGIEKITKILKELVEKLNTVVTEDEIEEILLSYYTQEEVQTILEGYVTNTQIQAYYTKEQVDLIVSALGKNSYRVAWDGSTQPTVANIPAGVVVTYNDTDYTGTLSASANTINSIYLVGQDMYVTSKDGNIYSWVFAGTTELELKDYATKAELSQLQQEVTADFSQLEAISTNISKKTKNLILVDGFKKYAGFSVADGVLSATALSFFNTFRNTPFPYYTGQFRSSTRYTFSAIIWTDGAGGTVGNGLQIGFKYSDDSILYHQAVANSTTSPTKVTATSSSEKTVVGVCFGLGQTANNTWYLKDIQLEEGTSDTSYVAPYTAIDSEAREEPFAHIATVFCTENNINSKLLYLHIENEAAARANNLFLSRIDPQYTAIYLGVPSTPTAIGIYDVVPGTVMVKEDPTYGKISVAVSSDWVYANSQLQTFNLGGLAFQKVAAFFADTGIETKKKLPVVTQEEQVTVPSECLANFDIVPEFPNVDYSSVVHIENEEELSNALSLNSSTAIVLDADVFANSVALKADKLIIGNGKKLCGYSRKFNGGAIDGAFRKYALSGLSSNHDIPQPYFYDENWNGHQFKMSVWFDSPGHITKADGSTTGVGQTGQHRVEVPSDFPFSASELVGTFIQWFGWFTCWVAKVDSFDGTYLYFTVGNQYPSYNPDWDYTQYNNHTSFRIYNINDGKHIYFDNDYLYVPLFIDTLYLSGKSMDADGNNLVISNCVLFGEISGQVLIEDSSIRYLNNPVVLGGTVSRVSKTFVDKTQQSAFTCESSFNHIVECHIFNTCENFTNTYTIGVRKSGISALIENNEICDFGYASMYIGGTDERSSYVPPKTIVQGNIIYQSEGYDARHSTATDSGAIYVSTWNNKDEIGAIVRNNVIHHYAGRGSCRGIFCDGGASYVSIYANDVTNIPNGYNIDLYYATGRTAPTGYADNNGKNFIGNKVDGMCVFEVGAHSTVKKSTMGNNIRIYGMNWDTADRINVLDNSAIVEIKQTSRDQFGYTDQYGKVISNLG